MSTATVYFRWITPTCINHHSKGFEAEIFTCEMPPIGSIKELKSRLIFNLRRSDQITDALVSLHWLRVSERTDYKIAVLTYRVLPGGAPRYLGPLTSVVDLPSRRALRSAVSDRLVVPSVRLSTVCSRAFPAAVPRIWNSLLEHVVTAATLQSFKKHLKTFLLQRSYSLAL